MIRKSTWIVLSVFVVLLAAVLILQNTRGLEFTPEATLMPTQASVFGLDTGRISQIQVSIPGGDSAVFVSNSDGTWSASAPPDFQPDPSTLASALGQISTWTIQDELSITPPLDAIGLNNPSYVLKISMDTGQEHTLSVGQLNPAQTGYYLMLDGASPVLVNRYIIDPVIQLLDLLHITPTPPPSPTPEPGAAPTP